MSRPPINPDKTVAGIIVDPQTLQRVIPESRRPDGSVRKQIKVRPGFTPQEDVKRFRGTRQAQMDANTLPKGHILGWVAPSSTTQPQKATSKSAKKNAKRKEKREEKRTNGTAEEPIRDNWEDDDDDHDNASPETSQNASNGGAAAGKIGVSPPEHTTDEPNGTTPARSRDAEELASDLEKLNVK